jgi:hypothetical protein
MYSRVRNCISAFLMLATVIPAACQTAGRVSVPADWTSRVLCSCDDASAFASTRDAARMKREFTTYSYAAATETKVKGKSLKWHVKPKAADQTYADIFLAAPPRDPFDAISVWVKNPDGRKMSFWVKLTDADGAQWFVQPVQLGGTKDWQRFVFFLKDYTVASWSADADGRIDFPLQSIGFVLFDLKPAEDYVVYLDDVEALSAPPTPLDLLRIEAPATVAAGGTLTAQVTVAATGTVATKRDLRLKLLWNDALLASLPLHFAKDTSQWPPGEPQVSEAVSLPLPARTRTGSCRLIVEGGGCTIDIGKTQGNTTVQIQGPDKATIAQVKPYRGVPTLFIDGKPQSGLCMMTYNPQAKHYGQFAEAGVHVYSFSATSDYSIYGLAPDVWVAPDTYDYSAFDQRLGMILASDPNALVFPRVYMCSPPWWDQKHPGELAVFDDNQKQLPPGFGGRKRTVPSWASVAWRRDAGEALKRFIRHIEDGPYANHVIGYHLASGGTEEWYQWGLFENAFGDYSHPQQEAFRKWLQQRYGTMEDLRVAWGQPKSPLTTPEALAVSHAALEWAQVKVPSKALRIKGEGLALLDPATMRQVIDYQLFHAEKTAETIAYFARIAKEATGGNKLCGAFYGYLFDLPWHPYGLQNGGHLALSQLLQCPDIDFLCAPTSYASRAPASGVACFMSANASIRAHGKLWFDENDIRTHLADPKDAKGDTPTDIAVQWRELALMASQAASMWWFDMGGGWYDDPAMMKAIADMREVGETAVETDRTSAAQIAVIVDDISAAYTRCGNSLVKPLLYDQRLELGRMGAPYDVWLLSDLLADRVPEYRMYVFLDAFVLDDAGRQKLREILGRDGKMAVWVYAPGAIDDELSPKTMWDLTGIRLDFSTKPGPLQVRVAGSHPLYAPDIQSELTYGTSAEITPVVSSMDTEADVMGKLVGSGRAGLVARKFVNWTSVFSAAPNLPAVLLRGLAKAAGVHLYVETDDPIYVNKSWIGLHARTGGTKTVTLPKAADVYDMIHKRVLVRAATSFSVELKSGDTMLVYVGNMEDIGVKASDAP